MVARFSVAENHPLHIRCIFWYTQGVRREPKRPDPVKDPKAWNTYVRGVAALRGLSPAEIARRCPEIPERRLRRLLAGDTHFRPDDMWAIANLLGMRIDVLFPNPRQRRAA